VTLALGISLVVLLGIPPSAAAQTSTAHVPTEASSKGSIIHVTGEKARSLISILATGNATIRNQIKDDSRSEIVLTDLSLEIESTWKFDPDSPYSGLYIYFAKATLLPNRTSIDLQDATALFQFVEQFHISGGVALEGGYIDLQRIDCTVNTGRSVSDAERFHCDLVVPSYESIGAKRTAK
jgi:hypothetical protein